jgi:tRNA1Val (adenine37-N6)-methyltransferase
MPNSWFHFKQFTIQQEYAAMKVGTDGVLVGAWASLPGPGSRVLDVGTGSGLIALMIAQRTRNVMIDALEIDSASARQAKENFENSPWSGKLRCIPASFQDYSSQSTNSYDLIISNPPYFSDSTLTPSSELNLARHDQSLSLEDLFKGCLSLMKNTAKISLILPVQKEAQVLDLMAEHKLFYNRLTRVKPAPGKPAKRLLLECSNGDSKPVVDDLTIETGQRHVYSPKFRSLVNEFYLNP